MKEGRVYPTRRKPQVGENTELAQVKPVKPDRTSLVAAWEVLHRQANTFSKWRHYTCTKRESRRSSQRLTDKNSVLENTGKDKKGILDSDVEETGLNQADLQASKDNDTNARPELETQTSIAHTASNRALLIYFAKLARANPAAATTVVDFDFVESLLQSGADVNVCDRYGQTILHEAARAWHCDVALFLLENGADVNKADKFGRTPMHVAAAVDYPEMITFLYEHGVMETYWSLLIMLTVYQAVDVVHVHDSKDGVKKAFPPTHSFQVPNDIQCGRSSSYCADGQTCCRAKGGVWTCCPIPLAECCRHRKCCPRFTMCSPDASRCLHLNQTGIRANDVTIINHYDLGN